jgi:hypothetical protein
LQSAILLCQLSYFELKALWTARPRIPVWTDEIII